MNSKDLPNTYDYREWLKAKLACAMAFRELPFDYQSSSEVRDAHELMQGALDDTFYSLQEAKKQHMQDELPF